MKKIFSFLLSGVLSLFIYASGITIGGKTYAVDTIVHSHDIGPGTKYAFYDIPAYPLKFHVMEVDLTNPYVDIETCLSGDKAVATETPSSMSARNNRPGHEVLGATNGDFYQIPRSHRNRNPPQRAIPSGRMRDESGRARLIRPHSRSGSLHRPCKLRRNRTFRR